MDVIRVLGVGDAPLSVPDIYASVGNTPAAGGIALFSGVVREENDGRPVTELRYSAHPSAEDRLREVILTAAGEFPIKAVSAVHRTGDLRIGDIAIIVAVACPRRAQAFDACARIVDAIKHTVPIWKHEQFADGTAQWVGAEG